MIELYSTPTANGQKCHIMLEETGLPYRAEAVDLVAGEHRSARLLAINPLGKLPAMIDPDGPGGAPLALGESGAIVLYLMRKTGQFGPSGPREQATFDFWCYAVNSSLAAALAAHFWHARLAPEPIEWAIDAFAAAAGRSLSAFDAHLARAPYLVGERFTAADALLYPHLAVSAGRLPGALSPYPALQAYVARVGARPGVQRGMAVLQPQNA
jgi:GST-like protein